VTTPGDKEAHGRIDKNGRQALDEMGGMLGGMFNGLVAPVLFTGQWEFPLALFAACLVALIVTLFAFVLPGLIPGRSPG